MTRHDEFARSFVCLVAARYASGEGGELLAGGDYLAFVQDLLFGERAYAAVVAMNIITPAEGATALMARTDTWLEHRGVKPPPVDDTLDTPVIAALAAHLATWKET